jgi:anti-anti-sigma regulatory factor
VLVSQIRIEDSLKVVALAGEIDDQVDFESLFEPNSSDIKIMHVHCKNISRINSVGIKNWIQYFTKVKALGIQVSYWECSSAIVQQINIVHNFDVGAQIESVVVGYFCEKCDLPVNGTFTAKQLIASGLVPPTQKCFKCGEVAEFDDNPKEYFKFLMRK